LSTIARNLALNQIARDRKEESLDLIQERGFDPPSAELGPLEQLITGESQRRFYAALRALPEQYRTVFVLRHYEEMSYEEIAGQLKIPPGTVDSRLYRARQLLVEALRDLL
jgi:RNA polymerase sigma-70 factor (ECF subfamily)